MATVVDAAVVLLVVVNEVDFGPWIPLLLPLLFVLSILLSFVTVVIVVKVLCGSCICCFEIEYELGDSCIFTCFTDAGDAPRFIVSVPRKVELLYIFL